VLVRSVPLDGGTINPEQLGGDCATELGSLLGAAPRAGLDLPCRTGDADLWFAEAPADLERAKALCEACPIKAECLAGALRREEPWGVWGGEIFERGVVLAAVRARPIWPATARTPRPCPPDRHAHP
jgi:WhiB family transcriptional regulator, redox-sensing transcriptional regulator